MRYLFQESILLAAITTTLCFVVVSITINLLEKNIIKSKWYSFFLVGPAVVPLMFLIVMIVSAGVYQDMYNPAKTVSVFADCLFGTVIYELIMYKIASILKPKN